MMVSINKQEILNKKQVKDILRKLKEQWGVDIEDDYVFLKNQKNKFYITNRDLDNLDLEKIRINNIGLYIGEITEEGIRLSIEGSQLVGPKTTKNVLELEDEQAREWLKGIDIEYNGDLRGFIILKNNNNFLGCGKAVNEKILNFIPKVRRIHASD